MTETVRTWTAGACPKGYFFQKSQCEHGDNCNPQKCALPTQKRQIAEVKKSE